MVGLTLPRGVGVTGLEGVDVLVMVTVLNGEVGVTVAVAVRVAVRKKKVEVGKVVRVRVLVGMISVAVRVGVIEGVRVGVTVGGIGTTETIPPST